LPGWGRDLSLVSQICSAQFPRLVAPTPRLVTE
jgi:hypothetical protein